MYDERVERRRSRVLLAVLAVALVVLLAGVIPSPFSIERPGPVVDTLGTAEVEDAETGETEEEPVISIPDLETYETTGRLNLLTVQILGTPDHPRSWLSLIPAVFDASQRIAPTTEFYTEGMTEEDRDTANAVLMDSSQAQAAAAAFRELGMTVGVRLRVADVADGGPAEGVLEPDDVLLGVDGTEIVDFADLRERIVAAGAGAPLDIDVERDGEERVVTITPEMPEGEDEPVIGASLTIELELPAEVDISLSDIGGPSAGMIFAIGIVDRLTPGPLLDGLTVSGTGTVTDAGEVGAIGGLPQKMWAAADADSDLFLMPIENCADLPSKIPGDLVVAPVATLDEALEAIDTVANGGTVAGVERCGAEG